MRPPRSCWSASRRARAGRPRARLASAGLVTLAAAASPAFWLVPLVAHLEMALPLAWGDASVAALAWHIGARPLLVGLCVAGAAAACWLTRRSASPAARDRWLALFAPALTVVLALTPSSRAVSASCGCPPIG